MKSLLARLAAVGITLGCLGSAEAAVRFVSAAAPAGGNGQSWATAYPFLQDALTAARVPGSGITEIWVAAGTYQPDRDAAHPTGTGDRNATFQLKSGVALRGGFVGTEDPATFDLATRDFAANKTALSGDLAGDDGPNFANNAENSSHVVTASGVASSTLLDGLTISGGNADGISWSTGGGAGVYCSAGSPTVTNCTFTTNHASLLGAGFFSTQGSPSFDRCTFSGNTGDRVYGGGLYCDRAVTVTNCTFTGNTSIYGGAIYETGGLLQCTDCVFSGNTALSGGGGAGICVEYDGTVALTRCTFTGSYASRGAVQVNSSSTATVTDCTFSNNSSVGIYLYLESSNASITGCTFSGNSSTSSGGIYVGSTSPTITNCSFTGNSATSSAGGAISCYGGSPTLTNCTFTGNSSTSSGGAVSFFGGNPRVTDCSFIDNVGSRGGGGVHNSQVCSPTFTNCQFIRNRGLTYGGGGMSNVSGPTPVLRNCVFFGNSSSYGGAVYNSDRGNPTLVNCTFTGNTVSGAYANGGAFYSVGDSTPIVTNCIIWGNSGPAQIYGPATATYSCIQGGFAGQGNISADPLVAPAYGNGRLPRSSPCVDAGNNTAVPSDITTDLAGNPRFTDNPNTADTGVAGVPPRAVVDMGAYECVPPAERLYVKASAAAGGDGASWSSAYTHLQDALAAAEAQPGVYEIWVADGLYRPDRDEAHPSGTGARSATFRLPWDVAVYGGFPGEPGQEDEFFVRDLRAHPSILSGDLAGDDMGFAGNAENSYHVVTGSGVGSTSVLDGFIIRAGNANGASPDNAGGGMHNSAAAPRVVNCTFHGNSGVNGGGMCNASGGSATIANCTFSSNAATSGGAIYSPAIGVKLTNCVIAGNSATTNGGGLYVSGNVALVNCTSTQNIAPTGAAIMNYRGSITATNCILWGDGGTEISGTATVTYSCVQGGYAGQGNIGLDPLFEIVPLYGFRLTAGSPCIDAGSNAAVPAGVSRDIDRRVRFMDVPGVADCPYAPGTCGTAPIVDMGAYEFIPARTVAQWRSIRSHSGAGPLPVVLDASATGQSLTVVTVEDRGVPSTGLGLQLVEVDFDGPVSLASPADVAVTCWATVGGMPGAPSTLTPVVTAVDADTVRFQLAGVPDASCVRVQINAGTINENLTGDADCMIRSLAGDAGGDGQVNLADLALTKAKFGQVAGLAPRCDINLNGDISLADLSFIKSRMTSPPRVAICP